jgi:hypothetical protein
MRNLNPFTLLDELLADYASPRLRRAVHTAILLVLAVVAIWMASEGDWKKFWTALGVAIYAAANKANTPPTDEWTNSAEFHDGQ